MHCASRTTIAACRGLHRAADAWRGRAARALLGLALAASAAAVLATDLTVSAAASLTNAFREIGSAFEAEHPGTKIQLNFAASGPLLQQIAQGAPVDVFASADQETMDQAERRQLVRPGSRSD